MDRRRFFTGCFCCAAAAYIAGNKIKFDKPQKIKEKQFFSIDDIGYPFLEHIEVHLVEHCNIGCKYCSHISTIAEKSFYDVEKFEKDIARLSEIIDKKLGNLELLGGEPLLHPQLNKIINISRKYFPKTNIEILTNGTLLPCMNDDFWITLRDNQVFLVPSLYPLKINWDAVLKKAEKFGVQVTTDNQSDFITLNNIPEYTINYFYKINLDLKGKQTTRNHNCSFKNSCVQYYDGKLYPCFVASNIRHFNKKFGKNIPLREGDYLDVYKVNSPEEIYDFVKKDEIAFCAYCKASSNGGKWESVKEHTIDEWLYDKDNYVV